MNYKNKVNTYGITKAQLLFLSMYVLPSSGHKIVYHKKKHLVIIVKILFVTFDHQMKRKVVSGPAQVITLG